MGKVHLSHPFQIFGESSIERLLFFHLYRKTMKNILFSICIFATISASAQTVTIDFNTETGPVKALNAVNCFPAPENARFFKNAEFPYARSHDANLMSQYGAPNIVDITAIFPDWEADVNKESSYNFVETDTLFKFCITAGTEIFYRLGESIEHTVKRYDVHPPKDYLKWAKICEHIIRHYNEGWADGYHWNIRYWEIWNEFELDKCWTGTYEQFFDFYTVVSKYLKKTFPDLKIGGPASCGSRKGVDTAKLFIEEVAKRKAPMDFFSWHIYCFSPSYIGELAERRRKALDENGYKDTESILNEWNTSPYDVAITIAGAAFDAATLANLQYKPIDMMMYYDVRPGAIFNGLFDIDGRPRKGYWAFYAWKELRKLGTSVKTGSDSPDIFSAAGKDTNGNSGILLAVFNKAVPAPKGKSSTNGIPVTINIPGIKIGDLKVQMVDSHFDFGYYPAELACDEKGSTITFETEAQSFAWITFKTGE